MGGKRWKNKDAGMEPPAASPVAVGPGWLQAKDAELTLNRLCGTWRDQKGSHYALSFDGGSSMGVITTRPGGKVIRTGGLIRIEWRNSNGRIVWGRAGARFLYKISKLDDHSVMWQSGDSYFEWERESKLDEEEPESEEQPEEEVHSGRKPKSKGGTQRLSTGFGERRARLRGEYQKQREQYEEAASSSRKDPDAEEYEVWGSSGWGRSAWGSPEEPRSAWGSPEEPAGAGEDGSPGEHEGSEEVGESQKRKRKKKSKAGEHAHPDADDSWGAWPSLAGGPIAKKWQPKLYPEKGQRRSEQAGEDNEDKSGVLKRMLGLPERQPGDPRKSSDEVRPAKGSDVASEEKRAQKDGKGKSHPGATKEEAKTKKDSYVDVVVKMFNREAEREAEKAAERADTARAEGEAKAAATRRLQRELAQAEEALRVELARIERARVAAREAAIRAERTILQKADAMEKGEKELARAQYERDNAGYKAQAMRDGAHETLKATASSAEARARSEAAAARAQADDARKRANDRAEQAIEEATSAAAGRLAALLAQEEAERQEAREREAEALLEEARRPLPLRVVGAFTGEVLCTVQCERYWTVKQLKAQIAAAEGTPAQEQRLLASGQLLAESDALRELLEEGQLGEVLLTRINKEWIQLLEDLGDGVVTLEELDEYQRDDPEVVLAAVRERGWELAFATARLRQDRDIVLAAVQKHGEALQFAGDALRHDRAVAGAAARGSYRGNALQYAAAGLFEHADFVLSLLGVSEDVLQYAPTHLLCSKQFAVDAVQVTGLAIKYLDPSFRDDVQVVFEASLHSNEAFSYAAPHFRRSINCNRQLSAYQWNKNELYAARFRNALVEAEQVHQSCFDPD